MTNWPQDLPLEKRQELLKKWQAEDTDKSFDEWLDDLKVEPKSSIVANIIVGVAITIGALLAGTVLVLAFKLFVWAVGL